jgi:hypothetical protein
MQPKFVIPAVAILTTMLAVPAFAQEVRVYGPGYYGHAYNGPAYRMRDFRGSYAYGPAPDAPYYYNGGWVPEPIFDPSRTGGIDPYIRPPS